MMNKRVCFVQSFFILLYIGTSSTNNSLWQSTNQTAGYCSVPSTQVTVNYVNAGEETVSIKFTLFSSSTVVNAAQTYHSLNFSGTSLLNVNDYDVLYSAPLGPYTNKENRLMAPLRSVSELLGAKVEYNLKSQEAIINWKKDKIVFYKGKDMYEFNGETVQMDTYPEVKQNSFIIPLGVLLRAMDIPFEYKNNKVVLQNESFNQSKVLQHVAELDWGRNNILDNNSIFAQSIA
jgi:hypothetical protein